MIKEINEELKLNKTHQLLVHAHDVNLVGKNTNIKEKQEGLLYASKEIGLDVNISKIKCMFKFCHQTARQNSFHKSS
jgi:hypothetical protein